MSLKSTFTNLYGEDVSKYLGYEVPQNLQSPRLPQQDDRDVNWSTRVEMTLEGLKEIKVGPEGKNVYWATELNQELPIKMGSNGISKNLKPETVSAVFKKAVALRGDNPAMKVMRDNKEYSWTWNQFYSQSMSFAKSLDKVGVEQRKVVNIMGFNSPEWAIAFFGSILHSNPVSGVYTTNGPDACKYQAEHSEAQAVVVDTIEQFELYAGIIDQLPAIRALICWGVSKLPEKYCKDVRFFTYSDFLEVGKQVQDAKIDQMVQSQRPGHCVVLIYTSGTTGYPKGVMLSHDNLIFNTTSVALETMMVAPAEIQIPAYQHRMVSYLPLSHIAGLQFDLTNLIIFGSTLYFAKKDALQGTLVETLQWCRPTLFLAVPRVWEKFEDKLKAIAATKPAILQSISGWAKGHGFEKVKAQQTGQDGSTCYGIAKYLILDTIKNAIGLDKCIVFFYGAAPLKQSSIDYFASLDIPLKNMYGLSETTGSSTVNMMSDFSLYHAGQSIAGCHIKIANPDEEGKGEIRIKGRHVMMGYLKNDQATLECIDSNGYFATGDQGRIDNGKFLKITGRIKELIITAGGENVAPVPIEDLFKQFCPACSNIMLVGENQRFMAALITFKVDIDMSTGTPSDKLTPEVAKFFKENVGVDIKTSQEACNNKAVVDFVQKCVEQTNKKVVSKAAHIKKFKLIAMDFSIPGGELTPTMKLKRKVTTKKYQKEVDEIYQAQAKM